MMTLPATNTARGMPDAGWAPVTIVGGIRKLREQRRPAGPTLGRTGPHVHAGACGHAPKRCARMSRGHDARFADTPHEEDPGAARRRRLPSLAATAAAHGGKLLRQAGG